MEELEKIWGQKRITVKKWTCNYKTAQYIDLTIVDSQIDIYKLVDENQYTIKNMGNNRFIIIHKDISQLDLFYALGPERLHGEIDPNYPNAIWVSDTMLGMETHIKQIRKHFPSASIIDLELMPGGWKNHYYFTIRLGEVILF